jgi:hypothetical protein
MRSNWEERCFRCKVSKCSSLLGPAWRARISQSLTHVQESSLHRRSRLHRKLQTTHQLIHVVCRPSHVVFVTPESPGIDSLLAKFGAGPAIARRSGSLLIVFNGLVGDESRFLADEKLTVKSLPKVTRAVKRLNADASPSGDVRGG